MSVSNVIDRMCKQTAVYWGAPVNDGYGGKTFGSMYPIEIDCRWEDKVQLVSMIGDDRKTVEVVSNAQVFVTQDLDEGGWLFLGTLDDLDSDEEEDPMKADGAYEIKRFDKSPQLHSTSDFIRKAYL